MQSHFPNTPKAMLNYRMVWRWHFYAGLFTLPFILILAMSGSVYLFKPQIEAWLEKPYDQIYHAGEPKPVSRQVQAALDAFPGSTPAGYQLPRNAHASAQVLMQQQNDQVMRVYVDPWTLAILHSVPDEDQFMKIIFRLHGELLMGNRGSNLVEIAASWTIIMILSGLYLWWPREANGVGGILYPRFTMGWKTGLRDLHAVIGVWVSLCVLFMLLTGLPWANFWGHYFKAVRQWTGIVSRQDWPVGSDNSRTKMPADSDSMSMSGSMDMGEHAGHTGNHAHHHHNKQPTDLTAFDRVFATVKDMSLDYPVVISPPGGKGNGATWNVKSLTDNRPRQVTLLMDGNSGEILQRLDFHSRPLMDRIVQTCIAAHEGQLFGWPNQVMGLMAALGLMTLSTTGVWMWWRRRQADALGAPPAGDRTGKPILLAVVIMLLAIYLPLFGATVLLVLILEKLLAPMSPSVTKWLGVQSFQKDKTS